MLLDKYSYKSPVAGPNVLFLGAIHGNETAGTLAMLRLKEMLDKQELCLLCGSLTLMPVCNPLAYAQNKRFVSKNLNRIIGLYEKIQEPEEDFANQIAIAILDADDVVDFHSTHCKDDKSFAFLDYPSAGNKLLVSAIEVDYVLKNWPDIYANQAEIADFSTEKFAQLCGKNAITIECGYHHEPNAAKIALDSMQNVLSTLGMIGPRTFAKHQQIEIKMDGFIIKKSAGQLVKNYNHLDPLTKGELIAIYENGQELRASQDGYILIPNHEALIGMEWFYLGH